MISQPVSRIARTPALSRWFERLVDAPTPRTAGLLRAAALALPVLVTVYSTWYDALAAHEVPDVAQVLAFVAGGLSLYLVRRLPVVPAVAAPLVWAGTGSCSYVMAMSVVLAARRPRGWLVVVAAYAVLHPLGVVPVPCSFRAGHVTLPEETAPLLGVVLPALVGYAVGETSRIVARREERLRLAAEVAAARAADVVAHERLRLSRDLHDVVGQSLSRMTLHATAIAASSTEAETRQLAGRIADTGAGVLEDLHFVVGLLRDGDGPTAAPPPSWQESIRTAEQDGLTVRRNGPARGCPARAAGLDPDVSAVLDAVLAEALHNAAKHAPGCTVDVRADIWPERVRLRVENPTTGAPVPLPSGGHGLAVAAERAAAVGGRLTHGRRGPHFVVDLEVPR